MIGTNLGTAIISRCHLPSGRCQLTKNCLMVLGAGENEIYITNKLNSVNIFIGWSLQEHQLDFTVNLKPIVQDSYNKK